MQGLICLQHIVNQRVIFIFVQKGSFYRLPPTPTPPPSGDERRCCIAAQLDPTAARKTNAVPAPSPPSLPPYT